ncbi:MAG: hypothetical protein A2W35_01195 [Chloroflexi bacterium RBG_16_57_11]|nr:MAG: hypothetical protein A2W35_01195 [Chloroflexi bacterium RBG_16_57_11]
MEGQLSFYLHKFSHLRTDRTGSWTVVTHGQAPHKPILLLSVLDLFAQGRIMVNLIEITPELGESFAAYWSKVMSPDLRTFIYSQHLIEQARKQVKETPGGADAYQLTVRDQGFRRAVVRIYNHRWAFCGVRMLTADGRTAVDTAHIIPWSISHDDDPHNGMALCGLCHWTFDQGLLGVSAKYLVLLSGELRITQNVPSHLLTLESRSIIGPAEQALWPHLEALEWHRQNVFRWG